MISGRGAAPRADVAFDQLYSDYAHHAAARRLEHFYAIWEGVSQLINVGDDEDALKVVLNASNRLNQALAALSVLRAEPSSMNSACRRALARCASSRLRAMRMAKFTRKASPPLKSS